MKALTMGQQPLPVSEHRGKDEMSTRTQLLLITIHSVATFLLAYFLVYLFNQLIAMLVASEFGISSTLRYDEVVFYVSASHPWSKNAIFAVSALSPVISLLLAILILVFGMKRAIFHPFLLLLLFWTGFHFFNVFFGGIIAGSLTGRGLGYALDLFLWPHISLYFLLSIFSVLSMLTIGFRNSRLFLRIAPTGFWIRRRKRKIYLIYALVIPWLIGTVLITLVKYPQSPPQHDRIVLHDIILGSVMFLLLIPSFFNNRPEYLKYPGVRQSKQNLLPFVWMILALLTMILFRYLL